MIQAVIFDLDGTILDNEGVWEEAFLEVARENQVKMEGRWRQPNGWVHEPGVGVESNWRRLVTNKELVQKLSDETRRVYQLEIRNSKFEIRTGLEDLIEKIKERGWRTALATSTYWYVVEKVLEELALQLAFDVTVTGEEATAPKPDPEIYLLTCQKLEVEPGECVVVEDSIGGVRAAAEAGCVAVALESDYAPARTLQAAGATTVAKNFDEVGVRIAEYA